MLNCHKEAMSACSVVTRLSPNGSGRLEGWLRGHATNSIWSLHGRPRERHRSAGTLSQSGICIVALIC